MQVAIQRLKSGAQLFGQGAEKLTKDELRQALDRAEQRDGHTADIEKIAASATKKDLQRMEAIRRRVMDIPSDRGHKRFQGWSEAIKFVRRKQR